MKNLRDVPEASFVLCTDTGFTRVPDAVGANAVFFECPCGQHCNLIAFEPTVDAPLSPAGLSSSGGRWKREAGTTLDDLTLSPSIAVRTSRSSDECWHGFIRDGRVTP